MGNELLRISLTIVRSEYLQNLDKSLQFDYPRNLCSKKRKEKEKAIGIFDIQIMKKLAFHFEMRKKRIQLSGIRLSLDQ